MITIENAIHYALGIAKEAHSRGDLLAELPENLLDDTEIESLDSIAYAVVNGIDDIEDYSDDNAYDKVLSVLKLNYSEFATWWIVKWNALLPIEIEKSIFWCLCLPKGHRKNAFFFDLVDLSTINFTFNATTSCFANPCGDNSYDHKQSNFNATQLLLET